MLGCYRYIELNPVRGHMVSSPGDYAWSSYAGNAGTREDALLAPHAEYAAMTRDAYRDLVGADDPETVKAIREATEAGFALVGDELKARLESDGARLERDRPGPRTEAPHDSASEQLDLLTE